MDLVSYIRQYNLCRRGDDTIDAPDPKKLGEALAALCDYTERLEADLETLIHLNEGVEDGGAGVSGEDWEIASYALESPIRYETQWRLTPANSTLPVMTNSQRRN